MNKIFLILIILVIVPNIFALSNNTDAVVGELKSDSSTVLKLTDQQLISALKQDPTLIENKVVLAEFEKRIESNIGLLNNNPELRKKWLSVYKITDNGAELSRLSKEGDKLLLKIKRPDEKYILFLVNDFPDSTITSDGKLILKNGAKIFWGSIHYDLAHQLNFPEGYIDITDVKSGVIFLGAETYTKLFDKTISSARPISLYVENGIYEFSGKTKVYVSRILSNFDGDFKDMKKQIAYDFTGTLKIIGADSFTVGSQTQFNMYKEDKISFGFKATKDMDFSFDQDISGVFTKIRDISVEAIRAEVERKKDIGVEGTSSSENSDEKKVSMIKIDSLGNLFIQVGSQNSIALNIPTRISQTIGEGSVVESINLGDAIKNIKISSIESGSGVNLNYHGSELRLSFSDKENFVSNGDLSKLTGMYISRDFIDSSGKINIQEIGTYQEGVERVQGIIYSADNRQVSMEALAIKKVFGEIDKKTTTVLLIASSEYTDSHIPRLPGTPKDVENVGTFFTNNGVEAANIQTIISPTRQQLLDFIDKAVKANPGNSFVIYYSGHGIDESTLPGNEDKKPAYYLIPQDAVIDVSSSGASLKGGVSGEEVLGLLPKDSPKKNVVILDACHSGGIIPDTKGTFTLAASLSNQVSVEGPKGGYFTGNLIDNEYSRGSYLDESLEKSSNAVWKTSSQVLKERGLVQTPTIIGNVIFNDLNDYFFVIKGSNSPVYNPIYFKKSY